MVGEFFSFLQERRIHPLVAFVRYLDRQSTGKVYLQEFIQGCQDMGYPGDAEELFNLVDNQEGVGGGYVTLNELDHRSADLWASFKAWCGQTFTSAEEMEARLGCIFSKDVSGNLAALASLIGNTTASHHGAGRRGMLHLKGFTKAQFVEHSVRNGWYGGNEKVIFEALDINGSKVVNANELTWLDRERDRHHKRMTIGLRMTSRTNAGVNILRQRIQSMRSLQAFCSFLKRKFGCLFRAWRLVVDKEGFMVVPRKKFQLACRELAWSGEFNGLWHALDPYESGNTCLENFGSQEARSLARFKKWYQEKYGIGKTAMRALNMIHGGKTDKAGMLNKEQWVLASRSAGYHGDAGRVFDLLDWKRVGRLSSQELSCLDKWSSPAEWLQADPNHKAAQRFRDLLERKYRHWVKAWCVGLDPHGVGKVKWHDFRRAAEKLHFRDDIAGAWVAMDKDSSGYISLKEIDAPTALRLAYFRCWAHDEFGSVALAFQGCDINQNGDLSAREFHKGMSQHGYKGELMALFRSLDLDDSGHLQVNEVAFLDEWLLTEILDEAESDSDSSAASDGLEEDNESKSQRGRRPFRRNSLVKVWPRISSTAAPSPPPAAGDALLVASPSPRRAVSSCGRSAPASCAKWRMRTPLHEEVLAALQHKISAGRSDNSSFRGGTRSQCHSARTPVPQRLPRSHLLHAVGWEQQGLQLASWPPPSPQHVIALEPADVASGPGGLAGLAESASLRLPEAGLPRVKASSKEEDRLELLALLSAAQTYESGAV